MLAVVHRAVGEVLPTASTGSVASSRPPNGRTRSCPDRGAASCSARSTGSTASPSRRGLADQAGAGSEPPLRTVQRLKGRASAATRTGLAAGGQAVPNRRPVDRPRRRRADDAAPSGGAQHDARSAPLHTGPTPVDAVAPTEPGPWMRNGNGSVADVARFYVTTPIYYVNDAPHIGHAYTTVDGRRAARWHRLLGDDVFFLTGTDEHGLKVQRAAEAERRHAPGVGRPHRASASGTPGSCSTSPTTTSSAPPSPATTRAVQQLLAGRATTTATSSSAPTRASTAWPARRTTPRTSWSTAQCPIHAAPVERVKEENYFFKLSRFEQPPARLVRGPPRRRPARDQAQRGARLHPQGLQDFSISRTSIDWGVPDPVGPRHVTYVWFDALTNYATAVGYGADRGAVRGVVAGRRATSSARTSCASTASTGRRCCWPPASSRRPG